MKKKIIIALAIALFLGVFLIIRNGEEDHSFEVVENRELVEEVFETGVVKSGDILNLSFQTGGTLAGLNFSEGEEVSKGDLLAFLDTDSLEIKKRMAENRIESQTIELNIAKKGADDDMINELENRLKDAERSLEIAARQLKEAEENKETNLKSVYSEIPSLVNRSYLLSKSLKDTYKEIRSKYFVGFYLSETYVARNAVTGIERSYEDLRDVSRNITVHSEFEEMDKALAVAEESFGIIDKSIETIIEISETDFYERRFDFNANSLLWETKEKASDMLSGITSAKSNVKSVREKATSAVTSAEGNFSAAKAQKNAAEDNLNSAKRGEREEKVQAMEANLRNAIYDLRLAEIALENARIHAPYDGKIATVHQKAPEEVAPGSPVITLISDGEFYIEADIYEGDIVSVSLGDPVKIELVPFPNEEFFGEVISINRVGKLINGVVYYEVEISIDSPPENIMPEMTADTTIETSRKETLSLSREAIRRDGARRYVKVLEDDEKKQIDVETGITDAYGYTQIISGLSEGDRVLID